MAGDLSFLPRDLRKKLLPFQREGIKFALSRKGRYVYTVCFLFIKCLVQMTSERRRVIALTLLKASVKACCC